jgi:hypothetical protein
MRPGTAFLLAAIALVVIVGWGFKPEAIAVGWHLRHGFHADGAGLRVRVPLLFTSIEGPDSIVLMAQNGRVRARFSGTQGVLIFISKKIPGSSGQPEPMEDWWKRVSAAMERQGGRVAGTRTITPAGHAAKCSEFEGGLLMVGVDIWCLPDAPGGWIMDFNGPRPRVPEFYSILQAAQPR